MFAEQTVILLLFTSSLVSCQTVITLSLNASTTSLDKELFNNFININASSTIQIDITDVNDDVSFIIFQVHSHIYNVTVSNDNAKGNDVTGKNVGLYSSTKPKLDIFYIKNPNTFDLSLLISIYGYGEKDPIPGGCNMEFPLPVSPFMRTTYFEDYIFVDAAPPRHYKDDACLNLTNVEMEFYLMYLPERSYDAETYYSGIRNMMSLEKIMENSYKIPKTCLRWTMRRMLSAYSGTGTIYVAVATNIDNREYYSVYVPTHNYACASADDDNGCEILEDILSKFICASLLFVGLFMCYFGHRFFKTEMFLFGMLSGVVITYIAISIISDLDKSALLLASVLSGVFFGGIWVTFWWFYGIPVIAVTLPALNLGFLLSAIMYSRFPGDVLLIQENFNFWTLFILVMTLSSLILVSMTFISNILCCAVLGAYAVIYPIDIYLGSNLKYIIINTVRRATVPKFSKAVLFVPFEWRDVLMVIMWVVLSITGFVFQHYHNRGRPPFPPPPRSVRPGRPEPTYGAIQQNNRNEEVPSAPAIAPSGNIIDERTRLLSWVDSTYQS